ncbi:hypothetical protein [Dyella koreensis]|uniref:DUF4760 domain-containing protein n=1 Tax=Dyella koreensis TaxID=311235 RepID=A0ABW8K8I2_9GAMM
MGSTPITHSLPTVFWWLGLNAVEQAAWAAAIMGLLAAAGGFAAAIASFRAARIALEIAGKQAAREDARRTRREETHAANIFNELALLHGHTEDMKVASQQLIEMDAGNPRIGQEISSYWKQSKEWESLVKQVDAESVTMLPDDCAPHIAAVVSTIRTSCFQIDRACTQYQEHVFWVVKVKNAARNTMVKCDEVLSNYKPFLEYAKRTFGAEIPDEDVLIED